MVEAKYFMLDFFSLFQLLCFTMDLREWCVTGFVRTELADRIFPTYRGTSGLSFASITPFTKQSEAHLASEWAAC